ncbi:MAG: outer membrane protein assembly factor BamD [Gemmatimonadetes bacterium]|nr:outer membrane protein assembly factor BamD [Gemmatimonadota bacterium]
MQISGFREWAQAALLLIPLVAGCAGNDLPVDAAPEDIFAHAQRKLAEEKYFDAAEALEYFLRSHPGTGSTPLAKLRLGDARFGLREYILAEGEYQQIVSDYPASPHVEEARYKIALCSYASILPYNLDQTETERAVAGLEQFIRDFPDSRFVPEAREKIEECRDRLAHGEFENGRFYQGRKRFKPASIQYKHVVENFPETPWAARSALALAEMYHLRERREDAESWFRRVQRDWPDSAEAKLAAERLADLSAARTLSQSPPVEDSP